MKIPPIETIRDIRVRHAHLNFGAIGVIVESGTGNQFMIKTDEEGKPVTATCVKVKRAMGKLKVGETIPLEDTAQMQVVKGE